MNYADDLRCALNLIEGAIDGMTQLGVSAGALTGTHLAYDELRSALDELPDDIADGENEHCLGCAFLKRTTDMVPYGDRMVPMDSTECMAPGALKCPAVNACGFEDPDRPETYLPKWLQRAAE